MEKEKVKQMILRMPDSLHKRIGHVAVDRGTNLTHCLISLLQERLEELEGNHKPSPTGQHVRKES
jgi:predicted HicB family RNase H-like nuclease